jgi:hypothetical protein
MSVRVAPGVVLLHENQTQLTDWVVVAHLYPSAAAGIFLSAFAYAFPVLVLIIYSSSELSFINILILLL